MAGHLEKAQKIFKSTPQFIIAFQRWPLIKCRYCESEPLLTAVETTNKYPDYKSCQRSPCTLSTDGVYYKWPLHSIPDWCSLILLCTTFMKFVKMPPPPPPHPLQVREMLPNLKMTPQNQSRFWTLPPSKMASPHHSPLISHICVIIWSLNLTAVTGTTETANLAGGGAIKFKCTFWQTPRNWKADQLSSGRGRY